jgi:ABC-type nitrate/sulfonate/bicarbonate transport system substrate-binding protein
MNRSQASVPEILRKSQPLRIGFVPVGDCAPLVFAQESGLFEQYELRVELKREARWANIRDKVIYGELDAAHAPATLPFLTNLGLDSDQCATVTGLVLCLQGNGIVISRELWDLGVRDALTLRELIYRDWGRRSYAFGVGYPHSPHHFLLRRWFQSGHIVPHLEARIVVIPPAQMFPTLKLGYVDGYCVGEPWISVAVEAEVGVCVATSAELAPLHPEKVLMVRRDFAREHASEHERLIAALIEACEFCDRPGNRQLLSQLLAEPRYVNAPAECLNGSLIPSARSEPTSGRECLTIFHRNNANEPTDDKAAWLLEELYETLNPNAPQPGSSGRAPMLKNVFRRDIFRRARAVSSDHLHALKREAERYEATLKRTA